MHYYSNPSYHYPSYGYFPVSNWTFVLIAVLFILLIIVGAACLNY
ncbi:MAG: YjcZ family sporulation protein [Bacillaceae bacterium]|nr:MULTISPECIES: YjcZ family sporulation protein [Aeribacillus]REJ16202.1 MAG: YjcZ family sporulation protein [Bacillaceae bacterium]MDR9795954.1 YjcZ family sporulation protein [Aeribacillus pallidus]MED0651589.1 YjcZ family sporulation protein [Aeribacillus composti]MED0703474.1 YjcZ family sporulation protein [Aeribacillus composti]MED1440576.1 YjcZ family sporulation protein [Aeribacillus composti]